MMEFSENKVVRTIQVPYMLTEFMVDCIICGSVEGGSNYWQGIWNIGEQWDRMPEEEFTSSWITHLILEGEEVTFYDIEDESEKWTLTLEKLISGIIQNMVERPWVDMEDLDGEDCDCIMQYALFNELVYG